MRRFLPILAFMTLAIFLGAALRLNPREVPSPFIGKPAPQFSLPMLQDASRQVSPDDMQDRVWLLNVWASWCVSCRAEHALLMRMAEEDKVAILGLNHKDQIKDAKQWLEEWGDPYVFSASDIEGVASFDWGVYGVPETFVVDANGIVRYKHIGPLDEYDALNTVMPLVRRLQEEHDNKNQDEKVTRRSDPAGEIQDLPRLANISESSLPAK